MGINPPIATCVVNPYQSLVSIVFFLRDKVAVFRCIVSVVINSIYMKPIDPSIINAPFNKRGMIPAMINRYTTATIIGVSFIFWVIAAALDGAKNIIEFMIYKSMLGGAISPLVRIKTSTRLCISANELGRLDNRRITAVTPTQPGNSAVIIISKPDRNKPAKSLKCNIFNAPTNHVHILTHGNSYDNINN